MNYSQNYAVGSSSSSASFADYTKAYDYDKTISFHSSNTDSTCSPDTTNSSLTASTSSLLSGGVFGDRNHLFSMPVDRSCCSPSP